MRSASRAAMAAALAAPAVRGRSVGRPVGRSAGRSAGSDDGDVRGGDDGDVRGGDVGIALSRLAAASTWPTRRSAAFDASFCPMLTANWPTILAMLSCVVRRDFPFSIMLG